MIPYDRQLTCAKNRLNSLRREVGRNQGEAKERLLTKIEEQEAIVQTIDRAKMLKEVGDEMLAKTAVGQKGELKLA